MLYALQVQGTLPESMAAHSALAFAKALLDRGHQIHRVFFFNGGATIANALTVVEQDEIDLASEWLQLAAEHNFELTVCVAAGQRRGMIAADEQRRYEKPAASARAGFEVAGLGQLIEAAVTADRLITFPA